MQQPLTYGSHICLKLKRPVNVCLYPKNTEEIHEASPSYFMMERKEEGSLVFSEKTGYSGSDADTFMVTMPGGLLAPDVKPIHYGEPFCIKHVASQKFVVVAGSEGKHLDCIFDFVCAKGEEEMCFVRRENPFEKNSDEIVDWSETNNADIILRLGDGSDHYPYVFVSCASMENLRVAKLISEPEHACVSSVTILREFTTDQYDEKKYGRFACLLKNHLIKEGEYTGAHQALIFDSHAQQILSLLPIPQNEEENLLVPSCDELSNLFHTIVKREHLSKQVAKITLLGNEFIIPEEKEMLLMLLKKAYVDSCAVWRATRTLSGDTQLRVLATVIDERYLVLTNCANDLEAFMRGRSLMALLVKRSVDNGKLLDF
ncbi:hypothetical protein FDP41_000590 [Naegleria fowleri]|uniref:Uncharacterized protein n=1 Tax=Naegleria fowleri TaxID=5763 RepID=A0A6A5CBN8_NAEFO|nr:uncharacterized protein FDP41_000590 [Naegleria fowleri]KAF0984691.1 hypothetical protein FDP41_000590 [Naegleria fowleri]CAG4716121.1 unnamed protein product [Naegleria fowleri]